MKRKRKKQAQVKLQIALGLFFVGVGLLAFGLLLSTSSETLNPNSSLAQYQRALKKHSPVFVFAHSTDCESCIIMMGIVDEVYPSFAKQIELIDVVVSEPENRPLMQALNIRAIPTMIFVDATGKMQTVVGPIEAEILEELLHNLSQPQ